MKLEKDKIIDWAEHKLMNAQRMKNRHHMRSNHEWRYGGQISILQSLLDHIHNGDFENKEE